MELTDILTHLPHRYPFLLVDRVVDIDVGVSIKAIKNVSANEPQFQGHFPDLPIFPGVLILEALAQASALCAFRAADGSALGQLYLFVGIDNARFKRQVVPGDQLLLQVEVIKSRRGIWRFQGQATVDGEIAATAELMIAVQDKPA
ncbi:MAG: 3-hydroxyacyl-ACP dehydratase FabZ [Pseudomonadota bacterium]